MFTHMHAHVTTHGNRHTHMHAHHTHEYAHAKDANQDVNVGFGVALTTGFMLVFICLWGIQSGAWNIPEMDWNLYLA